MKALVIGGTGPTGPYIVEGLLHRGYDVAILHRGTHEVEFSGFIEHIHGDPHFLETMQQALGTRSFDLTVATYGRLRHVAEAIKGRTHHFISVGGQPYRSLAEGKNDPEGVPVPIPESAPLFMDKARSSFAYLMTISELEVIDAHRQGHYSATHFRFPIVYGPRQLAPSDWSILRRILDGRKHLIVPDGGWRLERRGYVENMAHAILLAVDNPQKAAGQIYNVGDETMQSFRDRVMVIARIMNHEWELIDMPFAVAKPSRPYVWRAHHQVADITKIKAELGYLDVVPIENAIRQTVQWYLAHRPEPGGELEKQLGDPFDYAVEDRLIQEYSKAVRYLQEVGDVGFKWRHPYDHPAKPGV